MTSAIIVIPVIQSELRDFEQLSYRRCLEVLHKWPVCIMAPEGLDLSGLRKGINKEIEVVRFAADYFRSIDDYNRLMTSDLFYKSFAAYEFMLLYQLDAFVFEDNLSDWCEQGYDYIGAPAFNAEGFESLGRDQAETYATALSSHRLVFNGGFSLRRIRAMRRLLKVYNLIYPGWKGNEDMLFSLDATRLRLLKPFITLPDWKSALHFSFERSPAASYAITGGRLPFGCHAWGRYDPGFWSAFIH